MSAALSKGVGSIFAAGAILLFLPAAGATDTTISGTQTITTGNPINTNILNVGSGNTGALIINGGNVTDVSAQVGYGSGGNGSVTINSGTWASSNDIRFGYNGGAGTFTMNGGTVTDDSVMIGVWGASASTVNINGGNWVTTSDANSFGFIVGNTGAGGTLNITSGTVTSNVSFFIGNNPSSNAIVNLTGGTVNASSGFIINYGGVVNIGTGGAAGTLNTAVINGGSGSGTVNFNHTGTNSFAPRLTGSLTVNKDGAGTTILTASNAYTVKTTVKNGTLEVSNNSAVGTAGVTVSGGAFLIDAGVDIQNTITVTGTGANATVAHDVVAGNALANTIHATSSIGGKNLTATILSGTASGSSRIIADFGTSSTAINDSRRISDVFTLSGVPVVSGSATDIFTLQLSAAGVSLSTAYLPYIAWLDGNNAWVNAVTGNTGGTASFVSGAWNSSYGLGTYGLDAAHNTVWAVLDHNSEFAIVPEPSTVALLGLGLGLGLLVLSRRCRKQTSRDRSSR